MSIKTKRMELVDRKKQLINIAIKLSEEKGYQTVTRKMIADEADVREGTVTHSLGTMENIKRDIMRHSIKDGNIKVLAQGLSVGDKHAVKAPDELKQKAADMIASMN